MVVTDINNPEVGPALTSFSSVLLPPLRRAIQYFP